MLIYICINKLLLFNVKLECYYKVHLLLFRCLCKEIVSMYCRFLQNQEKSNEKLNKLKSVSSLFLGDIFVREETVFI